MFWTATEVVDWWLGAGGASDKATIAVAVAAAESNFNSDAISPAHDYGLWQINQVNFANLGITVVTALDPLTNARCAVRMSANGTNWAAWCTCWDDPGPNCGHGSLPVPQSASPAGLQYTFYLEQKIEGTIINAPDPATSATNDGNTAWAAVQNFHGAYARQRFTSLSDLAQSFKGLQS